MATSGPDHGQGDIGTFASVHKRGNAMFIVNINPKGDKGKFQFQTRDGANEDSTNLQSAFVNMLGFTWINPDCHVDLTTDQWDHRKSTLPIDPSKENCKCMRCRISKADHSQSQCFVLAISSHGREITETEVIFSDGKSIFLSDIFEALSDKNCPTLSGKPRIIILQVCRAIFIKNEKVQQMQDKGVTVLVEHPSQSTSESNPTASNQQSVTDDHDDPVNIGRFNVESAEDHTIQHAVLGQMPNHFLLVYPVVSGQKARRHEKDGSWLLHALKKIMQEDYFSSDQMVKPVNFLHLLTQVSGYVARERESLKHKSIEIENQSEENQQNGCQQKAGNHSNDNSEDKRENQSKNEQKIKEKSWVKDEEQSGFKNCVCIHHRLVDPIIFYPEEIEPTLPQAPVYI